MKQLSKRILAKGTFDLVYHGTGKKDADDIQKNGIDMYKSEKGFFGRAFYTTPNKNLAVANYAKFSDDEDSGEKGEILEFRVKSGARILDLSHGNQKDWDRWMIVSGQGKQISGDDFHNDMQSNNVDAIYEPSIDSLVVYNPKILKFIKRLPI